MQPLSPFPFLGQDHRGQASFTHLHHTITCHVDERTTHQILGPKIVPVAWARLVHAYTGHSDICFGHVSVDEAGKLEWRTSCAVLGPTTTLSEISRALDFANKIDSTALSAFPSILIDGDAFTLGGGWSAFSVGPLQVSFLAAIRDGGNIEYNFQAMVDTRMLSASLVQRMLHQLAFYVQVLCKSDVESRILDVPRLSPKDVEQIAAWAGPPQQKVSDTIQGCIERITRERPDRRAIDAWDGAMSYNQLNSTADRLAGVLKGLGMGVGATVCIIMEKSIQVPVVILSVLKTGAAFTMFDAKLPFKRLESMRSIAECGYAITSPVHTGLGRQLLSCVVVVDDNGDSDVVQSGDKATTRLSPSERLPSFNDSAFLVFTSGSSGVPKAVEVQHFAWCSTYTQHQKSFGIDSGTRVLQLSSFNFILSYLEILATLMVGGVVCIPSAGEQQNDLTAAICRLQPDWVSMTPSLAQIYKPEDFVSVKTLVLVGELVPASVAETWRSIPTLTVRNGYGQSEACSMNSTSILNEQGAVGRNIGRCGWVRYWIVDPLDPNLLVPVGAVGELLVEGYAIAKGYRNNEEKTRDAFIDAPTWASDFQAGHEGRRFYRTGDLVQFQEDGSLCLFGRKDAQVKIRGQRLEAAEVEHHILAEFRDEIKHVIVEKTIVRQNTRVEKLTAFVELQPTVLRASGFEDDFALVERISRGVLHDHITDLSKRISSRLSTLLPNWMVPTALIVLRAVPKTATGKLSRRSLHEQQVLYSSEAERTAALRDSHSVPNELKFPTKVAFLAGAFAKAWGVSITEIKPHHNWTNFGGDSLVALSLVREARMAGFGLALSDILSGKSLAEIAELMPDAAPVADTRPKRASENQQVKIPLTDFQAHCIRTTDRPTQSLVHDYEIRFRGDFDAERLARAMKALIKNTDSLNLSFDASNPDRMEQSLRSYTDAELSQIVVVSDADHDTTSSASPITYPIIARIARVPKSCELVLHLRLHHIVFDGTSVKHLMEDLAAAYVRDGPPDPRPRFWKYLQNRLLQHSQGDVSYWRDLLAGSSPTFLRVPESDLTASTSPLTDTHVSCIVDLDVRTLPAGITMSTVLKAAWAVVLCHMSNTRDVIFGYLVHGRDEKMPESEHVVGCCDCDVPCRVQLEEDMSSEQLLSYVGQHIIQGLPHGYIGSSTIARKCTAWGFDGQVYHYSSWMLHQNFEDIKHFTVGSIGYMDVPDPDFGGEVAGDFAIITTPYGNQAVHILMRAQGTLYSKTEIEAVLHAFQRCIAGLSSREGVKSMLDELSMVEELPRKV